jgi:2-oxoglutarate ferredoxin oxidoreductase subunit alpha
MGNGIWTTEIIPAEIQPPARSVAGASGIRIRIGSQRVTNGGDQTDLVVAFNEQVLIGRVQAKELKPGATILLESMWRAHRDPAVVASYTRRSRPCARTATRCTRCRWRTAARNW